MRTSVGRARVTGTVVLAMSGNLALAAAAFILSFTALRDLAGLAGVPVGQAWLWPLVVDGVILEATISVVALRDGTMAARRFAWLLLVAGAGISVAANITHALVVADDRVPALIAAFVASVPPLTLVASTHLTVELIRNTTPLPVPETLIASTEHLPAQSAQPLLDPGDAAELGPEEVAELEAPAAAEPALAAATEAVSVSRAEQQARVRQLALQTDPKLSQAQIGAAVGVHATTVGRWLAAPDQQSPAPGEPTADGRTDHDPDT